MLNETQGEETSEIQEEIEAEGPRETTEHIAASEIYQIEEAGKKFDGSFSDMDKSIVSLGLEDFVVKRMKEEIGFEEKTQALRQEEAAARGEVMREISSQAVGEEEGVLLSRRNFLKSMGIAMLLEGVSPRESAAFLGKLFGKEKEREESNVYHENIEIIRKDSMTDKEERVFGYFFDSQKSKPEKWIEYKKGVNTSARLPSAFEIAFSEGASYRNARFIHTHPMESYKKMFPSYDVENVRKKEAKPSPMPPSFMDISAAIMSVESYGKDFGNKIKYEVVDPTGVWRYSMADRKNDFIKKWKKSQEIALDIGKFLSEKELEIFRKFSEEHRDVLINTDPRFLDNVLPQELKSLLNKATEEMLKAINVTLGEEYGLFIYQSETLGGEIVKNMAQSEEAKEKRDKDIKLFIEGWKKKGIHVSYHPV